MSARPDTPALPAVLAALRGCRVTRIVIDDSVTLALRGPGCEAAVRIDGEGRFEHGGRAHRFSPDEDPSSLAPLLSLLNVRVAAVAVAEDGALELRFDSQVRLRALPDDHQVSWMARLSDGRSASCLAEGKVVWE